MPIGFCGEPDRRFHGHIAHGILCGPLNGSPCGPEADTMNRPKCYSITMTAKCTLLASRTTILRHDAFYMYSTIPPPRKRTRRKSSVVGGSWGIPTCGDLRTLTHHSETAYSTNKLADIIGANDVSGEGSVNIFRIAKLLAGSKRHENPLSPPACLAIPTLKLCKFACTAG